MDSSSSLRHAVWWMLRMVDLPWQSTNKRRLKTEMFHNFTWPA
jgi:hypothetical protein